jgi:hypothetical protein
LIVSVPTRRFQAIEPSTVPARPVGRGLHNFEKLYERARLASRPGRGAISEPAAFRRRRRLLYQQLTPDQGQCAILGPNESRTREVGPQIGDNFNVGGTTSYTNLRFYWEFDSDRKTPGSRPLRDAEHPAVGLVAGKPRSQ